VDLAWSLYGFGTCHELTRDPTFLEVAILNADFWLSHVGDDGIAPWDFDAPPTGKLTVDQVDTSASAIAASGLFDLARFAPNSTQRRAYLDCALNTLRPWLMNFLLTVMKGGKEYCAVVFTTFIKISE
jgi:unsaturated chondroitin disaccharide hydrolase